MKKFFMLTLAMLMVVGFTATAIAEVKIGGQVYFDTYYASADKETNNLAPGMGAVGAYPKAAPNALFDDSDTIWELDEALARVNASWKSGDLSAYVEMRALDASNFRHWWAGWNFGPGTVRIGQMWDKHYLYQASGSMNFLFGGYAYGVIPSGVRSQQIEFTFPFNKNFTWIFALQEPQPQTTFGYVNGAATDTDTNMPRLATVGIFNFKPFTFTLGGQWQEYEEIVIATDRAYDIESWTIGATVKFTHGPFWIKGAIWDAQNPRNNGVNANSLTHTWNAYYDAASDAIYDIDKYGWQVTGHYQINKTVGINITYEASKEERDRTVTAGINQGDEDDHAQLGICVPINITKGFTAIPTYAIFDEDNVVNNGVSTDQGKSTFIGVTWWLRF